MLDAYSLYERLKRDFSDVEAFRVPLEESFSTDCSPGKQIDLANAIYECIGKHAWKNTPEAPKDETIEKSKLSVILNHAKTFFRDHDPNFYDEVYDALTSPILRVLGNRNDCGDISHGHLASKNDLGPAHAALSVNLSLSLASYYFMVLEHSSAKMNYDENSGDANYNEWLNSRGERIGGASFSWLLYTHDYDAYENYFDDYQAIQQARDGMVG